VRSSVGLVSDMYIFWAVLIIAFLISALYLTSYLAALFIKQTEQGVVLALADGTCKTKDLRLDYKVGEIVNYCLVVYSHYTSPKPFAATVKLNNTLLYTFNITADPYTLTTTKFRVKFNKTGIYELQVKLFEVKETKLVDTGRTVELNIHVG
jgi:predicted membrane protein